MCKQCEKWIEPQGFVCSEAYVFAPTVPADGQVVKPQGVLLRQGKRRAEVFEDELCPGRYMKFVGVLEWKKAGVGKTVKVAEGANSTDRATLFEVGNILFRDLRRGRRYTVRWVKPTPDGYTAFIRVCRLIDREEYEACQTQERECNDFSQWARELSSSIENREVLHYGK
ncbi:hypothetical protein [Arcanobacterium canis]